MLTWPWLGSLLAATAVDAPVTNVTVFTDQARVTRTAKVNVSGETVIDLPVLPDAADGTSVRLEADGAEVRRVDLERVKPPELQGDEAKPIVKELQKTVVELSRVRRDLEAVRQHAAKLQQLVPQPMPDEPNKPATKLTPTQWANSAAATADLLASSLTKVRALEKEERTLELKRQALAEKAQKLGAPRGPTGLGVTATLVGNGQATVKLTYLVYRASWVPTWDLQFQPATNAVQLGLAGMVTQTTGEDWTQASLVLSTAIPLQAARAPKLAAWKIGTTERFIPAPQKRFDRPLPPPPSSPLLPVAAEAEVWKRLLAQAQVQPQIEEPQKQVQLEKLRLAQRRQEVTKDYKKSYEFNDSTVTGSLAQPELERAEADEVAMDEPAPPPPPAMAPRPAPVMATESLASTPSAFGGARASSSQPTQSVGFGPPPSWNPPNYGASSPVVLAGGYELSFPSLQKETVGSGKGTRRVALWSQNWPVQVERQIFPAIAQGAFLTAELRNPSQQVLPGGSAKLSVGNDPSGTAQLKYVAPGEAFTLPLGLDSAIRPVRNVAVVESVEGLLSKEDVANYTVTIEVVNPYKTAIAIRLRDQWPLSTQKEVVTKLVDAKPAATTKDDKAGHLEWRATLQPQEKAVYVYSYSIRRPKGWKMSQQEVSR